MARRDPETDFHDLSIKRCGAGLIMSPGAAALLFYKNSILLTYSVRSGVRDKGKPVNRLHQLFNLLLHCGAGFGFARKTQ